MNTHNLAGRNGLSDIGKRRRLMIVAGLGAGIVSIAFGGKKGVGRRSVGEGKWYEVVQDMRDARTWHINLFSGVRIGDLSRARLVERWTRESPSSDRIVSELELPWRLQYREGPEEKSF